MSGEAGPRRLLLVTGMSGAGKSTAVRTLEDLGWEVVDNLPLMLLDRFLDAPSAPGSEGEDRPLAVVIDSRTRGFDPQRIVARLARLREQGDDVDAAVPRMPGRGTGPSLFRDAAPPPARARSAGRGRHRAGARAARAAAPRRRPSRRHHRQQLEQPAAGAARPIRDPRDRRDARDHVVRLRPRRAAQRRSGVRHALPAQSALGRARCVR